MAPPAMSPDRPPPADGRRLASVLSVARRLGPVGPAMLIVTGLPIAGVVLLGFPLARLAERLEQSGLAGAVVFAIGSGTLAALSIVPMHLLALLGGWAFAPVTGMTAVFTGLVAAAALGYGVSTAIARRRVLDLLDEHPRAAAIRRALVGSRATRAMLVVVLLRLSPVMPFAATNLVMAAVRVPFGVFMLGTVTGMLPRVAAGVLVGAGLTQIDPHAPTESWPAAAGIAATILAVVVIGRIANRALRDVDCR